MYQAGEFYDLDQLAELLRTPGEKLSTVRRRLRRWKEREVIPYHQGLKGGKILFRLYEVLDRIQKNPDVTRLSKVQNAHYSLLRSR